jgi:hypothetical protein
MKRNIPKTWKRVASWAGLFVLCLTLTGETCTVDKTIEVTAGAEVIAQFEARGQINTFDESRTVDLATDADLREILEDNGFEDEVVAYIESAFVRVIKRDNGAAGRTVTGTVTVETGSGGGTPVNLILNQSAQINDEALAEWTAVPLESAGVNLINAALTQYLLEIYLENPNPQEPVLTFHVNGVSTPQDVTSDFDWEVKVVMTLVGKKEITVIDPL